MSISRAKGLKNFLREQAVDDRIILKSDIGKRV